MSGDQNPRVVPGSYIHPGGFRMSVGTGIGTVEKFHHLYAVFSGLQDQSHQIIQNQTLIEGRRQSLAHEVINILIVISQNMGMLGTGGWKTRITQLDEAELLTALSQDGKLVKRPILDADSFVLVGFDPATYLKKLG